jgi:hypothetical protein
MVARVKSFKRVPDAEKKWAGHLIEYVGQVELGGREYDYCLKVSHTKKWGHGMSIDIKGRGLNRGDPLPPRSTEYDCPECHREFSPKLFEALAPMVEKDAGFKVERGKYLTDYDDSPGWFSLWEMKPGVRVGFDTEPVKQTHRKVDPEVVAIHSWYEGQCPIHGKVKVHDLDVAD